MANPHYRRIKALNLDTKSLIASARNSCALSIRNTATGAWLAAVLDRLDKEGEK